MKQIKNILMWVLSVFMLISAVVFFPSAASIMMLLFAVVAVPIPKLCAFLSSRGLNSWKKPLLLITLLIVSVMLVPSGGKTKSEVPDASTLEETQASIVVAASPQRK